MRDPRFRFQVLLLLVIIFALAQCSGCASTPAPDDGPPPAPATLAHAAGCDTLVQDLTVPTGTNSAQLEELLYAAWLELRAKLAACGEHP